MSDNSIDDAHAIPYHTNHHHSHIPTRDYQETILTGMGMKTHP